MRIKLGATIPTVAYGNIQPEFEMESTPDEYGADMQYLEDNLLDLWDKYGERPLNINTPERGELLTDFFGNKIFYDPINHVYTNSDGEVYLSGSTYAESFRKPFDKQAIASAMAKKVGVDPAKIIEMWELKAEASRDFGNAIHGALQLYEQHRELVGVLNKTTNVHDHPVLNAAVMGFVEAHTGETVMNEVLVVDHKAKHAGQIDRLLIIGDKKCRIQDFKTGTTMKDLEIYWKQLEFYAEIVKANGWQVEGLEIFHYNGEWTTYTQGIPEGGQIEKVK